MVAETKEMCLNRLYFKFTADKRHFRLLCVPAFCGRMEFAMEMGLVHIYTGDGKGKTTAAIGQGIRAAGRGLKVYMVQFLKGSFSGELETLKRLEPDFRVFRFEKERTCFVWNMTQEQKLELKAEVSGGFEKVKAFLANKECDLLILDEIFGVLSNKFIEVEELSEFLESRPEGIEIVLTGRNAPERIRELADYVSEIHSIKHPFENGIAAREGIEY